MSFLPKEFESVELESYDVSVCSTAIPSGNWLGLVINAPTQIKIEKDNPLLVAVCGFFSVMVLDAMDGKPLTVTVNIADTDMHYSGIVEPMVDEGPDVEPPEDAPEVERADLAGVGTSGYFNIDIQTYLPYQFSPGLFDVSFSYAGVKSNVVRIKLVAE